jgi:hypothetical protein
MLRLPKREIKSSSLSLELPLITRCSIFGYGSRVYLLLFVVLSHETLVADIGEAEAFVDDDVGGVLVGGGVGGALVGVPFSPHVRLAALLLVVSLLLLSLSLLVFVPVTFTRIWTFSDKVTGLTTPVAHPFRAWLVVFPPPLLEDLMEAFDDKCHLLVVKLGDVNWKPTWCRLLFFRCFECNGFAPRCGGGALLQVDNMFGDFDHKFKAHKLVNHLLGRHLFVSRIPMY